MRFKTLTGKQIYKNLNPFRIDWDKSSRSKPQFAVKQFLKPFWEKYIIYEEMPVYGTLMHVDIVNASLKLAVEVQGNQHETYNPFFHGNRAGYFKSIKRDGLKLKWLELNDFKVIYIYENETPHLSKEFFKDKFGIFL